MEKTAYFFGLYSLRTTDNCIEVVSADFLVLGEEYQVHSKSQETDELGCLTI